MKNKKIKVIMLDIDGVLNCAKTALRNKGVIGIDPYLVAIFNRIIFATDAEIVISSSWRNSERELKDIRQQVMPYLDITPVLHRPSGTGAEYCERGKEIQNWLDRHPEVKRYAILDDDSDMLKSQLPNFFKTTWANGLTETISKKVIKHLNK